MLKESMKLITKGIEAVEKGLKRVDTPIPEGKVTIYQVGSQNLIRIDIKKEEK